MSPLLTSWLLQRKYWEGSECCSMSRGLSLVWSGGENPSFSEGTYTKILYRQPRLNQHHLPHHPKRRANAFFSQASSGSLQYCWVQSAGNNALKYAQGDTWTNKSPVCESVQEEPTDVTQYQQRRVLSSWMAELSKCSANLEHYWDKNSICRNFNQCKITQAPNPSPPQHAMSSILRQKKTSFQR